MELFSEPISSAPLAERLRPKTLEEVVGQEHLVGPGKPLTALRENPSSFLLWGPPGVGKTTIARLISGERRFHQISAVLSGVAELRKLVDEIRARGGGEVVFVDEIHRWNKAQQDSLLPHVENGTIILIGATTENPSFTLIAPLLSRAPVFVLRSLGPKAIRVLLERALGDRERGLAGKFVKVDDDALTGIVEAASGDGRRALMLLETASRIHHHVTLDVLRSVFEKRTLRYDRQGDQHYDIISAFIKSMRGSDPDAAVYWLARMYEAGEDPRFLARRMIIFASEDVGMADPRALQVAVAAAEAFERIGQAEGWIPLSQAAVYLATAPKSNSSYAAYKLAREAVEREGDLPVPLHLRNAPTKLMEGLGYGKGYEYAHAHLPEGLVGARFWQAGRQGFEKLLEEKRKGPQ